MGVVEIHTWNSTADDVEHPNRIVWDLDPGPDVAWTQTVAAARLLREVLETLGLIAWVKTTGGRGLHVIVPIKPSLDWSACLAFSHGVAETLVERGRIVEPALSTPSPILEYEPKTWGPAEASELSPPGGWHNPVLKG